MTEKQIILIQILRMSEVNKKREKFRLEINRRNKQEYFKKRRQLLVLKQYSLNSIKHENLHIMLKRSLIKDELANEVDQVIEKLRIQMNQDLQSKCEYIIAICSNLLIDNILLSQKEKIARLIYNAYKYIEEEVCKDSIICQISYSLISFANVLPDLDEEFASKAETLLYNFFLKIIGFLVQKQSSEDYQQIVSLVFEAWKNLITFQPEYKTQLLHQFSQNVLSYYKLLRLYEKITQFPDRKQNIIIRVGTLIIFEELTSNIELNDFLLIFESRYFIGFVLNQIINPVNENSQKMGLVVLTNLFIDLSKKNSRDLLELMNQFNQWIYRFLKSLLRRDCNDFYRLKLLKTILSARQVQENFHKFFEQYLKEIVDYCLDILIKNNNLQEVGFSAYIILILGEVIQNKMFYINYLISCGGQNLIQDVLLDFSHSSNRQEEQYKNEINNALEHILYGLKN